MQMTAGAASIEYRTEPPGWSVAVRSGVLHYVRHTIDARQHKSLCKCLSVLLPTAEPRYYFRFADLGDDVKICCKCVREIRHKKKQSKEFLLDAPAMMPKKDLKLLYEEWRKSQ